MGLTKPFPSFTEISKSLSFGHFGAVFMYVVVGVDVLKDPIEAVSGKEDEEYPFHGLRDAS